jgi:2-iminobutanoate/2-iminopropanoate deaminase
MGARQAIKTRLAPAAVGPYAQANVAGGFVFTAGQIGLDPISGKLVEGGVAAQTAQALSNIRAILAAAGCGFEDIVKVTLYLADLGDFAAANEVYAASFVEPYPARAAAGVSALPAGALVEIDAVAALPGIDRREAERD